MKHRRIREEILDSASEEDAAASLGDLRWMNRWLGGHAMLRNLVGQWYKPGDAFTALDVGAASGDMGGALRREFPKAKVISLDREQRNLRRAEGPKVVGDAFRLPFAERSFDVVYCSLFLHHFEDQGVAELLRGMHAVSRRGVVAIDLQRHVVARAFLPATRWLLGWHAITLHDGPISVEAGFRAEELRRLAEKAGLGGAEVRGHAPWFRLSLVCGRS